MTSSPAIERNRGFNEAINLYPELNKVSTLQVKNIELDINKKFAGILKITLKRILFSRTLIF